MPPVGCCTFLTFDSTTIGAGGDHRAMQLGGRGPAADAADQDQDD